MMTEEQFKILLYQYLIFKGGRLDNDVKIAREDILYNKHLDSVRFQAYMNACLRADIFREIEKDITCLFQL